MKRTLMWILTASLALGACSRYEQKPLPFRLPSAYPNAAEAFDVTVAARAFDDPAKAKELFGFDIVGAGVLPIQLIFDHRGQSPVEIVSPQTFLADPEGNLWNILEQRLAYERVAKKTEWGQIVPEAGKTSILGGAAGAIVGAAIAIVTGTNIGEAAGKGVAVGAAGGALFGGAKGFEDPGAGREISQDLKNRSLENKPIPPQGVSHGILFFPAEAVKARQLRLQLKNTQTGEVKALTFAL